MMQHSNPRSLFSFLFLALLPLGMLAFQEVKTASQDSVPPKKPEPIPIVRVVSEMEELRGLIDINSQKIKPNARLSRIDSLYPFYKELISEEQARAADFITSNPNRQKIDNLIRRWDEYRVQLTGWETEIMAYVDRNLRLLESFASESEMLELTSQQARDQGAPSELLSNIRMVHDDLEAIKKQTRDNNFVYLRLQTRINRLVQTVDEVERSLYEKKESETYDLFFQRYPPLWQISLRPDEEERSGAEPETLTDHGLRIGELLETHREKLYFLLVLGIGLAAFIVYLRRQLIRTIGQDSAGAATSESYLLFKMPWAVLAFLLLFTARLQLVSGTRFLGDILVFALLIFAILMIRHQIPLRFRGLVYSAILFMTLDAVKTYVWFYSGHYRLYMFFEAFLLAGAFFYFTRPLRETRLELTTPIGSFMIRLVPLAYFLCLVSIVSNLLGYTNLADLTLKIVTQSGIIAIIAYGLLLSFESIIVSWLEQRFHRSDEPDLLQMAFLKKRVLQTLRVVVFVLFAIAFLQIIDELRNLTEFFTGLLNEPYSVGNLTFTLGSIVMFLVILLLSYALSRLVTFLISDQYGLLRIFKLPKGVPTAISLVLRYAILVFGIILSLSYLNVDLSKFNLMAGALGLGIGFGLQNVISNFVSGLILVFERPILPGDTIEVNNLFGKVHKIGVRSSNIKTYDGAEVVVPNNNLISNDLINWTLSDSIKRVEIRIGATYGTDPNQVLEILRNCAMKFDYVLRDREPVVHFIGFGESSLDFRLWFWVPFEIGLTAQSDVNIEIYNQFAAHSIEIPYPQRDIHIKELPPDRKEEGS